MTNSLALLSDAEPLAVDHAAAATVLVFGPGRKSAQEAAEQFFATQISNEHTRSNYLRDVRQFASWCSGRGLTLHAITPVDVAAYRDQLLGDKKATTTVKRHLSALRMLFSYMVATGAMAYNPAREVKTPTVRRTGGKTPAFQPNQVRALFESFDTSKLIDLRDRAFLGTMAYTFCRVSAACRLTVGDYVDLGEERFIRLHEKGGVEREIVCHPLLPIYLDAWIRAADLKSSDPLFPTFTGPKHDQLSEQPMSRHKALQKVKRRLSRVELSHLFTNHSFRATGITTFLENGGDLKTAQNIAGHADSRTTEGYDRRATRVKLSEIARVAY